MLSFKIIPILCYFIQWLLSNMIVSDSHFAYELQEIISDNFWKTI